MGINHGLSPYRNSVSEDVWEQGAKVKNCVYEGMNKIPK
jgi:hypothetical protein